MSVGDGTGATFRFIRQEILSRFEHDSLRQLEDGSFVASWPGEMVLTTDSYVVYPPVFPGGDIGRLAIAGTVNDLAASGAQPCYITLALVVAAGYSMRGLRTILDSVAATAQAAGVVVVAGDTKVVGSTKGFDICVNSTGIGKPLLPGRDFALSRCRPGDQVVISGTVGDHGLAVISVREGLGFEQRVTSDCAPLWDLVAPVISAVPGVRALRDPTRGGLREALIDIAEAANVDVLVDRSAIPVRDEAAFGCEMLGLDPLDLANEGKMMLVVDPRMTGDALRMLRAHPLGRESAVIGTVCAPVSRQGRAMLVTNGQRIVLFRPDGLALPRLC